MILEIDKVSNRLPKHLPSSLLLKNHRFAIHLLSSSKLMNKYLKQNSQIVKKIHINTVFSSRESALQ